MAVQTARTSEATRGEGGRRFASPSFLNHSKTCQGEPPSVPATRPARFHRGLANRCAFHRTNRARIYKLVNFLKGEVIARIVAVVGFFHDLTRSDQKVGGHPMDASVY